MNNEFTIKINKLKSLLSEYTTAQFPVDEGGGQPDRMDTGKPCTPGVDCPPDGEAGACCETNGCNVVMESDCLGVFLGVGTTCKPDPCPSLTVQKVLDNIQGMEEELKGKLAVTKEALDILDRAESGTDLA